MTNYPPLKLQAHNHNDLAIISACLQDALLPASAIAFQKDEKIFSFMANRFMWEQPSEVINNSLMHKRVHTGVYFCNVEHSEQQNITVNDDTEFLNLMAIQPDDTNQISLIFSNHKQIRLKINTLACYLKDLHEPWCTDQKPDHNLNTSTMQE